jgi:hypothetical protein
LLVITSLAIQLTTLPLMALYFNLVAPVGVLLNIVAGLLTGVLMLTAMAAISITSLSAWLASQLGIVASASHYLLVNAIVPFADIPLASFRVAHYEGGHAVVYALYFIPVVMLVSLIDRWQPIDRLRAVDMTARQRAGARGRTARRVTESRRWFVQAVFCGLTMASALMQFSDRRSIKLKESLESTFLTSARAMRRWSCSLEEQQCWSMAVVIFV